ncbi:MAG: tRNA (N(6)-L-threonylcarbamoyladenosine(37)-C(2))-methylthiotransferase MtaB [Clostridiaceae bacterium]|nr:tRNA (N(6)-L-threonylcarbamoyladenosine(37)-C(2))-methylthiotransferase MtaB [Clostridiaceae bacterium]
MRKAAFHNLGCKVNSYETEAMQQLLEAAGYEIVPFKEGADVYIINTCSVTNIADRKSRQMLHKAKKMNPKSAVVAVGCYVQAAGEELKKDPAVDLIVGNNRKADLVSILEDYFNSRMGEDAVIDIGRTHEYENLSINRIADHTRAFIKVQDGCNQFCSYCIIPYTRGRVRSRSWEDVVEEAGRLAKAGYSELVLTGIHLSSYGIDFPEEKKENLLGLIRKIHQIEKIKRIRLGSLEPRIVTETFAAELSKLSKICPHFHLSLQSGCDETLKRMNRRYDTAEYEACCKNLRRFFDNPAITTDVIVGFPGETEEEFEQTRTYLERIHFYEMHVFKYSKRQGTRAAAMENQVPEQVKASRSDALLKLDETMSKEYRLSCLGSVKEVLLEEKITMNGRDYMIGHTKEYVKAVVPYEGPQQKNQLISGRLDHMLTDEIVYLV